MTTGELIGKIAEEKGINLRQLAISANINYSTLYAIVKRGSQNISREFLKKIADVLEVSEDYLRQAKPIDTVMTEAELRILHTINGIVGIVDKEEREEKLYYINSFLEANRIFLNDSFCAIKKGVK